MKEQKHIMTMLVDNQPGVLSRVVGLFSGKGFNIESLCVAPTMDPQVSRITSYNVCYTKLLRVTLLEGYRGHFRLWPSYV